MNQDITVHNLKERLDKKTITLIDVREEWEFEYCKIKRSKNIPMDLIPEKLFLFNNKSEFAIICHSGFRSKHVTDFLQKNLISAVNVIGGIDEWALKIDSEMKRY